MRPAATADPRPHPGSATLRVAGLDVRAGGVDVLHGIDLELDAAARTVVLGPNGAGKSTLLLALHGLVAPTAGSIVGVAPNGAPAGLRLALVFQRPVMLRRSVEANVAHALQIAGVPRSVQPARVAAALDAVGLRFAAQRPARRLSGGEQQRLALARAQALEPDCLLLDEPTSSLDPAAGAAIERLLLEWSARGRGFVLATHDLAQARRVAQRIVLLHRGRVIEHGDAARFFASPGTALGERFLAGDWLE